MRSQAHSDSFDLDYHSPLNTDRQLQRGLQRDRDADSTRHLKMPHIAKKMNSIEKYIKEFSSKQNDHREFSKSKLEDHYRSKLEDHSRSKLEDHSSLPGEALDPSTERGHENNHPSPSAVPDFLNVAQELKSREKNCLKYDSIADEKSEQRLEKLSRLEKDYTLLKEKIHPHKKSLTNGDLAVKQTARLVKREGPADITEEEVEKEIRSTLVSENGKKFFADLYLMKKGRENIMNSLSNAGKQSLGSEAGPIEQLMGKMSYEEKVRVNEKDFVSGKSKLRLSSPRRPLEQAGQDDEGPQLALERLLRHAGPLLLREGQTQKHLQVPLHLRHPLIIPAAVFFP